MNDRISARQLCVAWFTGMLAPAAAAAGLDWRGALLAVPVVALAVWAGCSAAARSGGLLRGLTGGWGKALAVLYVLWGVAAAGTVLALCGERLASAGHGGFFWQMGLAALPVLWLAVSKADAFARAGEIFYLAMAVVLAVVLVLGLGQCEWRYLRLEGEGLWPSFLTAAGIGCLSVYALLLWNGKGEGEGKRWLGWSCAGAVALAAMAAVTAGCLSPALAGRVDLPFFVMAVGLGRTARTEALVALLWLMADVTFAGLVLHGGRSLCREALGCKHEKTAGAVLTAAAVAAAAWAECFGDPAAILKDVLPWGGLALGGAVPVLLRLMSRERNAPG